MRAPGNAGPKGFAWAALAVGGAVLALALAGDGPTARACRHLAVLSDGGCAGCGVPVCAVDDHR